MTGRTGSPLQRARSNPVVLAGLLAATIKAVLLFVDSEPQFFLGDSASYLETAVTKWIPPDRSFTYGFVVRYLAVWTGSLTPLVVFQAAASTGTAVLVALVLHGFCRARYAATVLGALVFSLSPMQLYYERAVMTEALSLSAFAVAATLGFWYLAGPRLYKLVLMQVAGIVAVSLRSSYVPAVWLLTAALPLLAAWRGFAPSPSPGRRIARVAAHVVISVAVLLAGHGAYKSWYGHLWGGPPAYVQNDGFFLLVSAKPILRPADAPTPELAGVIASPDPWPRDLPHWKNRHLWHEGGIVDRWRDAEPDHVRANALARKTAMQAIASRPFAMLGHALELWLDYFRGDIVFRLQVDQGDQPLPVELRRRLKDVFSLDTGAWWGKRATPIKSAHMGLRAWYYVLAAAPALVLLALLLQRRRLLPEGLLLLGTSTCLLLPACILMVAYRFLQPQDFTVAIALGLIADALGRRPGRPPER